MKNIEFINVTKRYDDKLAVDKVNFTINEGELFGLLGPNGAGKSTLLSMLCGIVSMDKGDIKVGSYSIDKDPKKVKKLIGYVPQELAIFENLSIKDNLDYFAGMYGLKGSIKKERISEALEVTGLKERSKDKVKKLSGGMKRRLNIACAILHRPEVLIMDEPTVGIDPQSRNHILEFTKQLNKKYGTTIIYTSHYMEEIQSLCDKIIILDEGKEIIKGTKEEILRSVIDETVLNIKILNKNPEIISELRKLKGIIEASFEDENLKVVSRSSEYKIEDVLMILRQSGSNILNLTIDEPNLETVFLSLTGKQLRD